MGRPIGNLLEGLVEGGMSSWPPPHLHSLESRELSPGPGAAPDVSRLSG